MQSQFNVGYENLTGTCLSKTLLFSTTSKSCLATSFSGYLEIKGSFANGSIILKEGWIETRFFKERLNTGKFKVIWDNAGHNGVGKNRAR